MGVIEQIVDWVGWVLAAAARELGLFAAVGLAIGGIDDLAGDLLWIGRSLWRRIAVYSRFTRAKVASLPAPATPGRIALFVPAWRE
jgi:adsorption protein B